MGSTSYKYRRDGMGQMKRIKSIAAVWLSFVLALALLPLGGSLALADEPSSRQTGGSSGVVLTVNQVVPLSANEAKITYSVTNNADETLPKSNVIALYKRLITESDFIAYRPLKTDVQPNQTVQMTDTVKASGIGSVPLVLRIFDNGTQYPAVTPSTFPVGNATGHVANRIVDTTQTVALTSFSAKRITSSIITVTFTVENKTAYTVSAGSSISFYKNSPTKANFLQTRPLCRPVLAGTSATITQILYGPGIASEQLVARLFDINSGVFPYVYPSPFSDVVTSNKVKYAAAFKTKVVCVGDSITYGYLVPIGSYPSQLQAKLGNNYTVVNYGVNGTSVSANTDNPYTQTSSYKNALASDPDIVIIMLGTNDIIPRNWTAENRARLKDSYTELAQSFLDLPSAPQVYLATPVSVLRANRFGIQESVLANEVRPAIREVAAELGVPLIENDKVLAGNSSYFVLYGLLDGIHPSYRGYDALSTNIKNGILANR
jgi:lysophospholipase L1-like esterase